MHPFRVHGGPKNIAETLHSSYTLLSDKNVNSSIDKFYSSTVKNKKKNFFKT